MTGSSQVDATPCFLPLFLLFGGLAGSRAAAGPRAYGRYPLQQGYSRVPGYPPRGGFGYGTPGGPSYYSPWVIHPGGAGAPIGRRPGWF
ncbi:hypothetical protein [Alicyclobacillus suci]|uniref:hypothetical protein n=1 Tax=Alicyclobacillus suci TaxID=2816080 RepID=UPI001A8EAAFA|nr:hypothetical protein [Alicyclobacillus suci]